MPQLVVPPRGDGGATPVPVESAFEERMLRLAVCAQLRPWRAVFAVAVVCGAVLTLADLAELVGSFEVLRVASIGCVIGGSVLLGYAAQSGRGLFRRAVFWTGAVAVVPAVSILGLETSQNLRLSHHQWSYDTLYVTLGFGLLSAAMAPLVALGRWTAARRPGRARWLLGLSLLGALTAISCVLALRLDAEPDDIDVLSLLALPAAIAFSLGLWSRRRGTPWAMLTFIVPAVALVAGHAVLRLEQSAGVDRIVSFVLASSGGFLAMVWPVRYLDRLTAIPLDHPVNDWHRRA